MISNRFLVMGARIPGIQPGSNLGSNLGSNPGSTRIRLGFDLDPRGDPPQDPSDPGYVRGPGGILRGDTSAGTPYPVGYPGDREVP